MRIGFIQKNMLTSVIVKQERRKTMIELNVKKSSAEKRAYLRQVL